MDGATIMSDIAEDSESSELASPIPLHHTNKNEDILPNLSPASWLSEDSWLSMSAGEKVGFMEHVTNGCFSREHLLPFLNGRYYPTANLFHLRSGAITFGTRGIDRIVLGHGPRRVLVLVGIRGNEYCGVDAAKMIMQKKALFTAGHASITAGELLVDNNWDAPIVSYFDELTIEFLLGNPAALAKVI